MREFEIEKMEHGIVVDAFWKDTNATLLPEEIDVLNDEYADEINMEWYIYQY